MVELVHHKYTIKSNCPNCKEEVEGIKILYERVSSKDTLFKDTYHILGCPKCKNVFYHKEKANR